MGKRANRIWYLLFDAEVSRDIAMCVRVKVLKTAGFMCCHLEGKYGNGPEAFRQACRRFISSPIIPHLRACKLGLSGCTAHNTLLLPGFDMRFDSSLITMCN